MKTTQPTRIHPLSFALLTLLYPAVWAAEGDETADKDADVITIVSAQKRNESIQQVPITMNAFNDDQVRNLGAENIKDLGNYTPGMDASNLSATQPRFSIRGIGTTDFGIGSDPAVAVYIDGVYVGRSGAAQINFNDIERVEILKGPQGTLFGRNAGAGAIHIITKNPSDLNEASVRFTVREDAKLQLEGALNLSNGNDLHARFSFVNNQRDGYIDQVGSDEKLGNENNRGFRTSVLWNASADTDVLFRVDGDRTDQDATQGGSTNVYIAPAEPFGAYATDLDSSEYRNLLGGSLEITHRMDHLTFTSITAQRGFTTHNLEEEDGSANYRFALATNNQEELDSFSQEFRLTGESERHKWSLGAIYFTEEAKQTHNVIGSTDTLDTFFLYDALTGQIMENAVNNGQPIDEETARHIAQGMLPTDGSSPLVGQGMGGLFYQADPALTAGFDMIAGVINSQAGSAFSGQDVANMYALQNMGRPWTERMFDEGDFSSQAVYFDYTFSATDKLDITAGVRYTKDEKEFMVNSAYENALDFRGGDTGLGFDLPDLGDVGGVSQIPFGIIFFEEIDHIKSKNEWTAVSPRLVIDYQWSDNVMTFLSAAEGFKAGGFNSLGADTVNNKLETFDPENVRNYELGLKSTWLDNQLMLNLSAYHFTYDDMQLLKLTGPAGFIPTYNIGNADAEGDGYEMEFRWRMNDNFTVHANYSGIDTEYTAYDYTQFPGETAADDITGKEMSNMPDKYNIGFTATGNVGDGNVIWFTNLTHVGSSGDISGLEAVKIGGYDLVNTRISYRPLDNAMEWALDVTNLLDEEYVISVGGEGDALGSPLSRRGKPRHVQMSVAYFF